MDTPLTLVTTDAIELELTRIVRSLRELPVTDDELFRGTDERGRSGWFVRLTVGGMFPRRVGPYRTNSEASEVLEDFMEEIQMELFLNLMNAMKDHQVYVIEGVPTLLADAKRKAGAHDA
jgi:hypothetical protein